MCGRRPQTIESAQYSLPFLVAVAIAEGKVTPAQLSEENLRNEAYLTIADRVKIMHNPQFDMYFPDSLPTELEIVISSGEKFRAMVSTPKGDPKNPLSMEEMLDKFRSLAHYSVTPDRASLIIERVLCIENLDNVQRLTDCFL